MSITKKEVERYFGNVMKPTKQRLFKGKIYGFDIETANNNKEFVCASIYHDESNKWIFYSKKELINFLKTKRFWNSVIAATNLAFDFFGTFHKQKEMQNFNTLFRGSDLVYARTYIRNKKFQRKSYEGNRRGERKGSHGKRLLFIDTFNYCKMSVEKLGNIIKIPKTKKPEFLGKRPATTQQWNELIRYNMQDSRISKEYIAFLYSAFEKLGATPKATIASTAMSLFKNKYLKEHYYRHDINELLEQFKAYYGGRTEAFCRGKIENYNYYDFNSLYPSVMTLQFPDPNSKHITYKNTCNYIRIYDGVSHVDVFCPKMKYPLLPYRTKDKLVFGYGSFTGWYSHVELREALALGYVIKKVHKTYYFTRHCHPFKEYVETLYGLRKKYKDDGNAMEQVVKLLLNSLYGKFGQKFMDRDNWIPFNLTKEELDKLEWFERQGDYIRVKKHISMPSNFCFPIWALYTTAYARIKLHKAIVQTNPVYVDTDSLVTKNHISETSELGGIKKEMTVSHGMVVKPKFYAFRDDKNEEHVKIKGVGKRLTMMEFNSIIMDPKVVYMKFMKFKESIRRGFVPNEIQEMTKNLNLEDDKRLWDEKFNPLMLQTSLPVEIIEGMTEIKYEIVMRKAMDDYERKKEKQMEEFINSDLFDKASVGHDISSEEFIENEKWFDVNE